MYLAEAEGRDRSKAHMARFSVPCESRSTLQPIGNCCQWRHKRKVWRPFCRPSKGFLPWCPACEGTASRAPFVSLLRPLPLPAGTSPWLQLRPWPSVRPPVLHVTILERQLTRLAGLALPIPAVPPRHLLLSPPSLTSPAPDSLKYVFTLPVHRPASRHSPVPRSPAPPSVGMLPPSTLGVRHRLFYLSFLFRSSHPPPLPRTPLTALYRQLAGTPRPMEPALPPLRVLRPRQTYSHPAAFFCSRSVSPLSATASAPAPYTGGFSGVRGIMHGGIWRKPRNHRETPTASKPPASPLRPIPLRPRPLRPRCKWQDSANTPFFLKLSTGYTDRFSPLLSDLTSWRQLLRGPFIHGSWVPRSAQQIPSSNREVDWHCTALECEGVLLHQTRRRW